MLCPTFFQSKAKRSKEVTAAPWEVPQMGADPEYSMRESRFFLMFFQNKLAEDYWQHLHKTGKDAEFNTPVQAWNCFKSLQLFPSQHMGWSTGNKA